MSPGLTVADLITQLQKYEQDLPVVAVQWVDAGEVNEDFLSWEPVDCVSIGADEEGRRAVIIE